jgi:hypothetical protein
MKLIRKQPYVGHRTERALHLYCLFCGRFLRHCESEDTVSPAWRYLDTAIFIARLITDPSEAISATACRAPTAGACDCRQFVSDEFRMTTDNVHFR